MTPCGPYRLTVDTHVFPDRIEQTLSDACDPLEHMAKEVFHLKEEGIQKALSELGYLSPDEASDLVSSLALVRETNRRLTGAYLRAAEERDLAQRRAADLAALIGSLKAEWEKNDWYKVDVADKLEALVNLLYLGGAQ